MKTIPKQRRLAVLLCAAGLSAWVTPSFADLQTRFSGFGTVGVARTDKDGTQFRQGIDQFSGADNTWDLGVDSRLAVQGTATYNDFAFTGQVLGSRRFGEEFRVGFEWIYAQYTGVPGLDVKLGRVVLPAFLVSDSRLVGYAVPWLRVPTLVYSLMPLSNVDGGQATYRHSIGDAVVSAQLTHGGSKTKSYTVQEVDLTGFGLGVLYPASVGDAKNKDILGVNVMLEWGDWTARLSQVKGDVTLTTNVALPFPSPANVSVFEDTFREVGLQYDNGQMLVVAEYVKRKTEPMQQNANAWYVGGGYRFGSVMPYVIFSQMEVTEQITAPPPKARGLALGARWDFASNLSLKAELAQYKTNSVYAFTNIATPAVADKKINVLSVALDFVF